MTSKLCKACQGVGCAVCGVAPDICPSCKGPMDDLRGTSFDSKKQRATGRCFVFSDDLYECQAK